MMKVSSAFYFFCSNKMRGLAFSSIALVFFIVLFGGWLAAEEIVGIEKSLAETGKQVFKSDSVFVEADSFESAESKFQAGDDVNAKLYYQKYLNTGLGKKYVDRAIFRLAQIDFRSRYYVTALRYLNYLVEKFPDTPRLMKAKFMMGVCHFEMDHVGAARRIFENQLKFNPDVGARWKSIYYLSRLDEKNLDYIQAIGKLRKVYQKSPDRDTRIEAARIGQSIIEKKISAVDLKALIKKFKTGFPVDLALWRLISLYRIQRDNDNYLSALQQFLELFPNHQYRSEAEKFLGQAHNKKSFTYKLGAILPLTGKHALTGQKVLQGVQLAFNQLPPEIVLAFNWRLKIRARRVLCCKQRKNWQLIRMFLELSVPFLVKE